MKTPMLKPSSDNSFSFNTKFLSSSPTSNSQSQYPILRSKPSRNNTSIPFEFNFTQTHPKKSGSLSISNDILSMNGLSATLVQPVGGKLKTEDTKKPQTEATSAPNFKSIIASSASIKANHKKKMSQPFIDPKFDDVPILTPGSSIKSIERPQFDYYSNSADRNKPKGPRVLEQPTKKELPLPPLPLKERAQSMYIPTTKSLNFRPCSKPSGPRSFVSSRKSTFTPNYSTQFFDINAKLTCEDFSKLQDSILGCETRPADLQLRKKETLTSTKTERQPYRQETAGFPAVDTKTTLSTHFFENQTSVITNEEEDVLRRFFDVAPPPPPKNHMTLSPRIKTEVQRSQSEDTLRFSKSYPRRVSLKPPCSTPARRKEILRNRPSDVTDRSSIRSVSPRTGSVTGLFNLVKTHAASKTSPIFGEGGVLDPQLNKLLTKLSFEEHVSQLELPKLLVSVPWLSKLFKSTSEANIECPTLEALTDSLPSSKSSTPNNERAEYDDLERNVDSKLNCSQFQKKRCYLIRELAETESNYLGHLVATLKLFKTPVEFVENILIPTQVINGIFGNISKLVDLSSELSICLQASLETDFETSSIGSIFLSRYSDFNCYLVYVRGYRAALGLIDKWEKHSAYFRNILIKGAQENPARQTLKEMLILPIQRLTRYSLLLRSLLSFTPYNHPDYKPLEASLKQLSLLAVEANDLQRDEEEATAAQAIFDSINNCPPSLRELGLKRPFISEAQDLKLRRRICLFIYSDSIMFASARKNWSLTTPNTSTTSLNRSPKWKFIQYLPLSRLDLVEIVDAGKSSDLTLLVIQPETSYPHKQLPDSIRYYLIQHFNRRSHLEFLHIIKTHLQKAAVSSQSISSDSTICEKIHSNPTKDAIKPSRSPFPKLSITLSDPLTLFNDFSDLNPSSDI